MTVTIAWRLAAPRIILVPQSAQGFEGFTNGYGVEFIMPIIPDFSPGPTPRNDSDAANSNQRGMDSEWMGTALRALDPFKDAIERLRIELAFD